MQLATIQRIIALYGLQATEVREPQKGYRNESYAVYLADGTLVNVILYKREPGILHRIRNANRVADYLADQGLSVRRTYRPETTQLSRGLFCVYAALYTYLPGHTIAWEAYTMQHLKLLGAALSDMHAALRPLPQADLPDVAQEYGTILKRLQKYFADQPVRDALRGKLQLAVTTSYIASLQRVLRAAGRLPGRQALHMDFVRGNVLYAGKAADLRISGILDFEKTAWGHPCFDIARTLAFLLVDCKYKTADQVRKYFLYSGYTKRGRSTYAAVKLGRYDLLHLLTSLFLLHDFYKFLRHNPYESLPANEHFIRTRDILLARGILVSTGL